jgi:hypothetical protein
VERGRDTVGMKIEGGGKICDQLSKKIEREGEAETCLRKERELMIMRRKYLTIAFSYRKISSHLALFLTQCSIM